MNSKSKQQLTAAPSSMRISLLGPMQILVKGVVQDLPRSKKTRALLAYLIMSERNQRRDKLGELLWDVTDDPKGALRWSLSRLKQEIDWPNSAIVASRQDIHFNRQDIYVDALELARIENESIADLDNSRLIAYSQLPQGSFLEELELGDSFNFNTWCISQRERFRKLQCCILSELLGRFEHDPQKALPFSRQLAVLDPFNISAQTQLFRTLKLLGSRDEAQKHFDNCCRLFRDLGASGINGIHRAWLSLKDVNQATVDENHIITEKTVVTESISNSFPFVGRKDELAYFKNVVEKSQCTAEPRVFLLQGEPGSGKSRLADRWFSQASNANLFVLMGKAFEVEQKIPYKPWLDALQISLDKLQTNSDTTETPDQEALFKTVIERIKALSAKRQLIIIIDDLQWFDRASLELLHYLIRAYSHSPLVVALFARTGELADNSSAEKMMHILQRDFGAQSKDLALLESEGIRQLVSHLAPKVDAHQIYQSSSGNPLYAIEIARSAKNGDETPKSLMNLVRARIERLPNDAIEVIQWGAVLGQYINIGRIETLCSINQELLVEALECLEKNALFRIDTSQTAFRYKFSHDIVRQAVYSGLSWPRRRLMHKKVVDILASNISDVTVASEIAFHAGRAGESLLGARACLVAGSQALRVFASGDAEDLARQGLKLAEQLQGDEQIIWTLKLLHLLYSARKPEIQQASERLTTLAERALAAGLTHEARLGFQMLSFLRWENASLSEAHNNILQAERISRQGTAAERASALAQAAKCFLLLERNLNQAEAFLLEVKSLMKNGVLLMSSFYLAQGMLAKHRGEFEEAQNAFQESMAIAHQSAEHLEEFAALEQLIMLKIDHRDDDEIDDLKKTLIELGSRVRHGIEEPTSKSIAALIDIMRGSEQVTSSLLVGIEELKQQDAKYQLAFMLTCWARELMLQDKISEAKHAAEEALNFSLALGRPSDVYICHQLLAACAKATNDTDTMKQHTQAAGRIKSPVSAITKFYQSFK